MREQVGTERAWCDYRFNKCANQFADGEMPVIGDICSPAWHAGIVKRSGFGAFSRANRTLGHPPGRSTILSGGPAQAWRAALIWKTPKRWRLHKTRNPLHQSRHKGTVAGDGGARHIPAVVRRGLFSTSL